MKTNLRKLETELYHLSELCEKMHGFAKDIASERRNLEKTDVPEQEDAIKAELRFLIGALREDLDTQVSHHLTECREAFEKASAEMRRGI